MSFIKWHKKQVEKNLNMFGLSNYQGLWVSFIKGLIFGAIIMWFVSCNDQVIIKEAPASKSKKPATDFIAGETADNVFVNDRKVAKMSHTKEAISTSELQSDYSIGVKGNCGMCKSTIEKAVKVLDFVKNAEWGISTKILDVEFIDSVNFDLEALNSAINQSGYETMNTTADQTAYDALPMCCKYDRNMVVYGSKSK